MLTFAGQFYVNDGHLNFISLPYFGIFPNFRICKFSVDMLRPAGWTIITSPCTLERAHVIESTHVLLFWRMSSADLQVYISTPVGKPAADEIRLVYIYIYVVYSGEQMTGHMCAVYHCVHVGTRKHIRPIFEYKLLCEPLCTCRHSDHEGYTAPCNIVFDTGKYHWEI